MTDRSDRPPETIISVKNFERERALKDINRERERQVEKWGDEFAGRDPLEWLAIIAEELAEVAELIYPIETAYGTVAQVELIRHELIQTAATCVSALEHLHELGPVGTWQPGRPDYASLAIIPKTMRAAVMTAGAIAKQLLKTRENDE